MNNAMVLCQMQDKMEDNFFRQRKKTMLAAKIPIPYDRCAIPDCPFFAPEDHQTCSIHYGLNAYVLYNRIPNDVIKKIIEFTMTPKEYDEILTEDQIINLLHLNQDLFFNDDMINEKIFWFTHHPMFHVHCDDIMTANLVLQLDMKKKLKKDQAERLMNVISSKFDNHTCIAFEKAIFLKTFVPMNLDRQLFSVAYCYLGNEKPFIVKGMSTQKIKRLLSS